MPIREQQRPPIIGWVVGGIVIVGALGALFGYVSGGHPGILTGVIDGTIGGGLFGAAFGLMLSVQD